MTDDTNLPPVATPRLFSARPPAKFNLWIQRFELYVDEAGIPPEKRARAILSLLEDEPFRVCCTSSKSSDSLNSQLHPFCQNYMVYPYTHQLHAIYVHTHNIFVHTNYAYKGTLKMYIVHKHKIKHYLNKQQTKYAYFSTYIVASTKDDVGID